MSSKCVSHASFSPSLRKVESCQNHIKSFYGETTSLQSSLLGQVLLGERLDGNGKNVIKMCMKEMQQTLRDRILEDPRTEISVMEKVCINKHPNFVQLMDATEDRKLYCTIQEYVSDGDLCTYIQKYGGLEINRCRRIIKQIVNATDYLHNHNYCHLDLSLENILIDLQFDIIKLCDFGLCRKFNSSCHKKFSPSMIRPGKPGYTSPEIFNYQSFDGCKSDIWSIGVMIFILLTGFPPFTRPHLNDRCFAYLFNRDCNDLFDKWNLNEKVPCLARNLLNQIFVNEDKRIHIKDMLQHPFLSDIDDIPCLISLSQEQNVNQINQIQMQTQIDNESTTQIISNTLNSNNNNNNLNITTSITTTTSVNSTIEDDYDDKYIQEKESEIDECNHYQINNNSNLTNNNNNNNNNENELEEEEETNEGQIQIQSSEENEYNSIINHKRNANNNNSITSQEMNDHINHLTTQMNDIHINNNDTTLLYYDPNNQKYRATIPAIEHSDCKCCYHSYTSNSSCITNTNTINNSTYQQQQQHCCTCHFHYNQSNKSNSEIQMQCENGNGNGNENENDKEKYEYEYEQKQQQHQHQHQHQQSQCCSITINAGETLRQ